MRPNEDLCWAKVDYSEARPQQWYYKGDPCEVLDWGVAKGADGQPKLGAPVAMRIRDNKGNVRIVWEHNGEYPGLTYEVFEHQPGNA